MQEDQIYALQDYIQQYQRLLCQYRSENCLCGGNCRRELFSEPQPSEPSRSPRTRTGMSLPRAVPQFQTPRHHAEQAEEHRRQPPIETPDVPPLKRRRQNEPRRPFDRGRRRTKQPDSAQASWSLQVLHSRKRMQPSNVDSIARANANRAVRSHRFRANRSRRHALPAKLSRTRQAAGPD